MSHNVINQYQTFRDSTGTVRAGGFVTFYENTTTTLAPIFSDEALMISQDNPYTLDAYGRITGDVKYSGLLTLKIQNADLSDIRTDDNVAPLTSPEDYLLTSANLSDLDDTFVAAGNLQSGYVVADKAEAAALTLASTDAGRVIFITSEDGGEFTVEYNVTPGTYSDNGGAYTGTVFIPSGGDGTIGIVRYYADAVNVKWFGAKGNSVVGSVTDDLASFDAAETAAYLAHSALYIPGVPQGQFYALSDEWLISDRTSFSIFGDGRGASSIVSTNAAGANCITLDGTIQFSIRNIGISGYSGSGHGIELINASHYGEIHDVWIGWMDGDGLKITSGISFRGYNIRIDQNNGYDPASIGGATRGNIDIGVHIPSNASKFNNDAKFFNCTINGVGQSGLPSLSVGDSSKEITSFAWYGGLIQANTDRKEVVLTNLKGSIMSGVHIEPPSGANTNYVLDIDSCRELEITGSCVIQGDTRIVGSTNTGLSNVVAYGVSIDSDCEDCYVKNTEYDNSSTGPLNGNILDEGKNTTLEDLKHVGQERYALGDFSSNKRKTEYFRTNMQDWVGTTEPCGWAKSGATITRESTTVKTGTYSAKAVYSAELTQFLQMTLAPLNMLKGKKIVVEAQVYNETTAGLGYVSCDIDGTTYHQQSFFADQWERMQVSFDIPSTATTSVKIRLTGLVGTVYWDSVSIHVEDYTHRNKMALDGTATPSVSYGGYQVPLIETDGTPTITNFLSPHVGKPFTLVFRGATVITDGANIKLAGGNFTGTTNDTMTLVYMDDGIFYEMSRSVN